MANEEHLALLKQGVDVWNDWKINHPDIRPNLSFAKGNRLTSKGAKLSGVDLSRANLSKADLSKADLIGANLSEANLSEAYLSEADLIGADLSSTDLSSADLISANLIGAYLSGAYLSGADLSKANLSGADLIGAKLIGAKLSGANLSGANLSGAILSGAHLKGANLKGANLKGADFSSTNLVGASLQRTKAQDTNFSRAVLTGACLEDWHTNSRTNFEQVSCDYVYLKANQKGRCPSQGRFAPGEFTELFQKALDTVDLTFRNGIDWQAFFAALQKLQMEGGGKELAIQAFENKASDVLSIRIAIPPNANKVEVERYLKQEYERELKAIDKEYRYQLQANYDQIAAYRQQSANLLEIVKLLACRTINVNARAMEDQKMLLSDCQDDSSSANNGRSVDALRGDASYLGSNQPNYTPEQKQDLIDAATKIQKLLYQLEQAYPTNTPLDKQMVVTEVIRRIESNPSLRMRVSEALKGVSTEVLKELIDHPLANVLLAALADYQ